MKHIYPVEGMHCASCATIITKKLTQLPGVDSCEVNFGTKQAAVVYDETAVSFDVMRDEVGKYGYLLRFIESEPQTTPTDNYPDDQKNSEMQRAWQKVLISIPLVALSVIIMVRMIGAEYGRRSENVVLYEFFHHLLPVFATVMITVVGRKYVVAIWRYIRYGVANMDTLVGIGTVTAFTYSFLISAFEGPLEQYVDVHRGFYEAVIVVIGFIELGKYMEMKVMTKTGQAIKALVGLQAKSALILKEGKETMVPLEKVQIGDIMLVKSGEKVPLDGIVVSGSAYIDESMITGEPLPVRKSKGNELIGSTIVKDSTLQVQATAVGSDTYLSKIIGIVQQAQNSKPSIQKIVDRIMTYFIPFVLVVALLSALFRLFWGTTFFPDINAIQFAIMSFVGVLVIACPCGLGLATPMAIITGIGHGAKHGILAKNAEGLLKLRKSNIVAFDKTGTLTEGKPKLVEMSDMSVEQIALLVSLENLSSHPLAYAVMQYASEHDIAPLHVDNFVTLAGSGIQGDIGGVSYLVSSPAYLESISVAYDRQRIEAWTKQGKTPLILSSEKKIIGYFAVADDIKSTTRQAIKELKDLGIIPVMLTGDHLNTATYIAHQLGIERFYAQVTPEQKAEIIRELQKEGLVTMVGDGINDAPALATADIGIAMSTGTDVAIESAELTLLHGDLSKLVKAINISKLTQSAILQNLAWAFGFNLIGIPLAAGVFYPFLGVLLNPAFEGAAMAFSDLTVVGNSLRLQAKKI